MNYELLDEGGNTRLRLPNGTEALFVSRDDADAEGKRLTDPALVIWHGRIPVRDRVRLAKAAALVVTEGEDG